MSREGMGVTCGPLGDHGGYIPCLLPRLAHGNSGSSQGTTTFCAPYVSMGL